VALNLDQKKAVVAEVAEVAANAHSAIAAEYIGVYRFNGRGYDNSACESA
jgi:hypothetical protein